MLIEELALSLHPEGKIEEILVEKIGGTLWRLQRLISAEASALNENDWMGRLEAREAIRQMVANRCKLTNRILGRGR